ncbi:hypothetical protein [Sulfuriferula nivalis]|uniref:Uncharacterized protein n=1 Tax=Sulfuriferula nivalis TaxID=2675298 RepID=A0A809RHF7_9PROT|nr:hypothetical protein [Sulfuriferula nivalis]BBP00985.1 hypothetical protein SFSGTM_16930 [Sulfuriferula nivalis]
MHTLPNAVQHEREALLSDAVGILKTHGYKSVAAQDLAGYQEPDELLIPVLNVHMRPDIFASSEMEDGMILGVVEVSTDLGEESCGRRWQAFNAWANDHHTRMQVYVHPEDLNRATEIAKHWHMVPDFLVSVKRTH